MKRLPISLLVLLVGLGLGTAQAQVSYQSASSDIGIGSGISFVNAGTAASATSGNVTPALPAGIAQNDLLVCLVASRDNVVPSISGWNQRYSVSFNTDLQSSLFWKIAGASESNPTVSYSGAAGVIARCFAFRGIDTSSPFDVADAASHRGTVTGDDKMTTGSLTTVTNRAVILIAGYANGNVGQDNGVTPGGGLSWNTDYFSRYNPSSNANDVAIGFAYASQTTAGAIGPLSLDTSGNANNQGAILALKPAPRQISIAMPSGTSLNDVLIATLAVREDNAAVIAPVGWTLVLDSQQPSGAASCSNGTTNGMRLLTYYKVAIASEPTATWGYSSTCFDDGFAAGGILRFSGVDTSNPIVISAASLSGSSATVAAPAVAPGIANTMLVTAHAYASSGTWTTPPPTMNERVDQNSYGYADDTGTMLEMNTESIAAATSTGVRTATGNAAGDYGAGHSLILRPRSVLVSIASLATVVEGNAGTTTLAFTVSLSSSSSSNVTVSFAASDVTATKGVSCTTGVDYVLASNTLTIVAGSTTGTISATICGDTAFESNETFTVTLSGPTNATLGTGSATGTISNDDTAPTMSVVGASVTEGNSGTTSLIFTVTLSAASGLSSSASYALTDGTATGSGACTGGIDFINTGGTVTVAIGATTGTITVPVCGDTTYETNETFTITLSAPTNATLGVPPSSATGTIIDDDATLALAEYRMDGASWSGTVGEVLDSSGSYPGRAMNSANTTDGSRAIPANPGTCRYGLFDNGTTITKGYVELPGFPNLSTDFTITAWIRTTDNTVGAQRILIDDETNSGGYGMSLAEGGTGALRFYSRGSSQIILDTPPNTIANNTWYFVAGVADITNGIRKIYVYDATGNLLPGLPVSVASTGWGTDTGMASIGGETNASLESTATNHFKGNIDEVRVYQRVLSQAVLATVATQTHPCPINVPHHLVIQSSGSGLTCAASTLTVIACQDAACATLFTPGVSGTLSATGTPTVNWNGTTGGFVIPNGSSSATKDVQVATAGTVTFGIATATVTPTPTTATTCNFGTNSPTNNNCVFTANTAGFIFSNTTTGSAYTIPPQVSGIATAANALYLRAVQASTTNPAICTPAIISSTTAVNMGYACNNPTTCQAGNLTTINATAIAPGGTPVDLTFDANGSAPITARYDDVGQITLNANATVTPVFTGATPVALTGSSNAFVVAPHHFGFSSISAGPIKAGNNFAATVTAYSGLGTPTATRNFGKESSPEAVSMSFTKCLPTGAGTANGSFSGGVGSFNLGAASASNLNWSEVGNGDLTATLASGSYLGSGLSASGNTGTGGTVCNGAGNVGRFTPDHFDTAIVADIAPIPCPAGLICPTNTSGASGMVYSNQPIAIRVTAKNATGGTTANYQGVFAKANTFSAWSAAGSVGAANPGGGTISNTTLAATAFSAGVGTTPISTPNTTKPTYTLGTVTTAPTDVYFRAVDTDGITSLRTSPVEAGLKVASGRISILNVYGSERLPLPMTARVQYYNGANWLTSTTDNATSFNSNLSTGGGNLVANIVSGPLAAVVVSGPGTATVLAGVRTVTLAVPLVFGSVNISLNAPSYLPSSVGRATFGIYKSPLIYRRENY